MYRILSLLWLCWAVVGNAAAQEFPSRPVTLTVLFAAAGPADVIGRILASGMSKVLNQQLVIENTVGAGGTIGTARVASSPPDGYSLLLMHVSHAANVAFYPSLRYDPVKDFEPIGLVAESPMAIVARKDLQQFQGIRCLPVSEQRQDDIRLCRRWVGVASVQPPVLSRDQYHCERRSVQRHGSCAQRSARRPSRLHVR